MPGTLAYIAPERLRGGDATAASDVWAVGVLLWESLAGEHPFWGVPLPAGRRGDRGRSEADRHAPAPIFRRRSPTPSRRRSRSSRRDARRPSASPPTCGRRSPRRAATGRSRARPRQAARPQPAAAVPARSRSSGGSSRPRSRPSPSRSRPRCCRSGRPGLVLLLALAAGVRDAPRAAPRPRDRALRAGVPARERRAGGRRDLRGARRSPGSRVCWRDARAGLAVRRRARCSPRSARSRSSRSPSSPHAGGRGAPCRRSPASSPRLPSPACAAQPLPLTGRSCPNLGHRRLDPRHRRRPGARGRARGERRRSSPSRSCSPLAAAVLPDARRRGLKGIARARSLPDRPRPRPRPGAAARSRSCSARALLVRRARGPLAQERPLPLAGRRPLPQ